jgi:hypothetical protein
MAFSLLRLIVGKKFPAPGYLPYVALIPFFGFAAITFISSEGHEIVSYFEESKFSHVNVLKNVPVCEFDCNDNRIPTRNTDWIVDRERLIKPVWNNYAFICSDNKASVVQFCPDAFFYTRARIEPLDDRRTSAVVSQGKFDAVTYAGFPYIGNRFWRIQENIWSFQSYKCLLGDAGGLRSSVSGGLSGLSALSGGDVSLVKEKALADRNNGQYGGEPSEHLRVIRDNLSGDILNALVAGAVSGVLILVVLYYCRGKR